MIGTLNESSLHAALKQKYTEPGDKIEEKINHYVVDLVRENLLIEIQTINFSAIKKKLETLLKNFKVLLVYPIIKDKWIINLGSDGETFLQKRLSPLHGSFLGIFKELIYIPNLLYDPNLIIEALLIQVEEIRLHDDKGRWKRKSWIIDDRKLVKILERKLFSHPAQLIQLIPNIKSSFTNQILAEILNIPIKLARMITYTLRKMNLLAVSGKIGNNFLFKYVN